MKYYTFKLNSVGLGNTPEEAWDDVVEGFTVDPGPFEITDVIKEEESGIEEELDSNG